MDNILCILTIYNEIDFLEYKREWCRSNGMRLFVIDNYSTDFSYEWCLHHKVNVSRIDTKNSFDLRVLQKAIVKEVDRIEPDWVCYNGADLFIFAEKPINEICRDAEKKGYNSIGWPMVDICNTGEERGNPFRTYFWYRQARLMIEFVYKWQPGIKYSADSVKILDRKSYYPPGIMINYGRTKSVEKRKELLKRRQKAWDNGLDRTSGRHYLREQAKGWKWKRSELKDIRKSEYWKYIKI